MALSNNLVIYIDPWIIGIVSIFIFYMIGLPDFSGEYSGFAQGALIFGVPLIIMMIIDECRSRYNFRNSNTDAVELIVNSITQSIMKSKNEENCESIENSISDENDESTGEDNDESIGEGNDESTGEENDESTSEENDEENDESTSEENNNSNNNPFMELIVNSITQSIVESVI